MIGSVWGYLIEPYDDDEDKDVAGVLQSKGKDVAEVLQSNESDVPEELQSNSYGVPEVSPSNARTVLTLPASPAGLLEQKNLTERQGDRTGVVEILQGNGYGDAEIKQKYHVWLQRETELNETLDSVTQERDNLHAALVRERENKTKLQGSSSSSSKDEDSNHQRQTQMAVVKELRRERDELQYSVVTLGRERDYLNARLRSIEDVDKPEEGKQVTFDARLATLQTERDDGAEEIARLRCLLDKAENCTETVKLELDAAAREGRSQVRMLREKVDAVELELGILIILVLLQMIPTMQAIRISDIDQNYMPVSELEKDQSNGVMRQLAKLPRRIKKSLDKKDAKIEKLLRKLTELKVEKRRDLG